MKILVTRRVILINPIGKSKVIRRQMEMKILRVTMIFTLLTAIVCDSVTRVVVLIPHTPLDYMIHSAPVYKIINPSPCLLPIYFKRKWQHQASQFPKSLPIMEEVLSPHPLSMTVLLLLLSAAYTIWVLRYLILSIRFKQSLHVNITRILFLILNYLCSFMTYRRPVI